MARSRTGSPATCSGKSRAIVTSDCRAVVVARADNARADGFGKPAGGERLLPQYEARGLRAHRVADHGGERGEMLGRAFDAVRPAPLALADVGGRKQFGQGEDAGQRCADVMRKRSQRRFGRVIPC